MMSCQDLMKDVKTIQSKKMVFKPNLRNIESSFFKYMNTYMNQLLSNQKNQQNNQNIQVKRSPAFCKHNKWTINEDMTLCRLIKEYGELNWNQIAEKMDGRNSRQCRERWQNYLNPDIKIGDWTQEEDELIFKKRIEIGPKWKQIATFFENRTDSMIKTRYNALIRNQKKKNISIFIQKIEKSMQKSKSKKCQYHKESNIKNDLLESLNKLPNYEDNDEDGFLMCYDG